MAIKSFQAAKMPPAKKIVKNILVRDIMTKNLILFRPKQSIHDVMKAFIKYKISGGPVVNKYGDLMGIISEADCMKEISESRYFNMPILDKSVYHFMTKDVETIEANNSVFDAASTFFRTKRRRFPVLDNKKLVGQVSRKDIVIAALNLKSQTWH
ncbi:MAG: inosine-5-monophosphate dehydrogenase [Flavobacteriaceae bacterium]|jgi:CBS domain-containing protein|nr:inosine-5-monophosphate dehydrogenase [Flavobacteriaceae bacterium]|tara:strand:- start:1247 stop:1711 length:465 start_codon:yes stop_codon:yes gene_type:complete